jgi:hypothetical protein
MDEIAKRISNTYEPELADGTSAKETFILVGF